MLKNKIFFIIASSFAFVFLIISVSAVSCFPQYECGPWSTCEDGIQSRTCEDKSCNNRDIIERAFCDKPGCKPQVECQEWGPCSYTEKTDSLIKGKVSFGGYRNRVCEDVNGCVESFIQEGSCEDFYDLQMKEVSECNVKFLAISDPKSQREIAKINLDSWKTNKFDISFIEGTINYCPDCYNTIKDAGEEGIDCGGKCKSCKKETTSLIILLVIGLWMVSALFSFLSIREIVLSRRENISNEKF